MSSFLLVGKPNSGKSSLFNLLTGLNQKIGNYAGATTEKKSGKLGSYQVLDLPGLKSLRAVSAEEEISKREILNAVASQTPVVFVVNGMQLEDNLMLFSEIADLQIPCLVAINFKDDLEKNQVEIDHLNLKDQLGCPVVLLNSRNGDGVSILKKMISSNLFKTPNAVCRSLYDEIHDQVIVNKYQQRVADFTISKTQLDQNDFFKRQKIVGSIARSNISDLSRTNLFLTNTKKWDRFLLHPFYGILFFLITILIVFQSVFYLSGIPMDWIDAFFAKVTEWGRASISLPWLADLVCDGIIPGLGGVLIFVPQIAILFFLLGVLEHSGYLSRISFISNRLLTKFGLSGQSVIPLMSSWACAIPAIMSAKAINDPKERMAVILASPLMTCSARLPVYTILIAIMVPATDSGFFNAQGLLLMMLYLLGVLATLLVAWLVSRRNLVPGNSMWSLELPVYRVPNWRNVFYNVYSKTKAFVVDAGKVIFIVSIILWALASFSPQSDLFIQEKYQSALSANGSDESEKKVSLDAVKLEYSYAGYLGKTIEPVIRPLGYDWKIGIALISSFAAREVFVGSLSTIYSVGSEEEALIQDRLVNEINVITGKPRYNFATCLSLLLFYVFALQCMSTVAIVRKEVGNWKYPIIQFLFMLFLAYVFALGGYIAFS